MEPNRKNWKSVQWLLWMIAALSLISGASTNKLSATTPQTTESPLVFRIALKPKIICRGRSLVVRAELANRGRESVAIDRRLVWYRSTFKYSTLGSDGSIKGEIKTATGDFGLAAKDESDYLILRPGQSYKTSRSFKFDEEFLNSANTLTVRMTYGQFLKPSASRLPLFIGTIDSNSPEFKIGNCQVKR